MRLFVGLLIGAAIALFAPEAVLWMRPGLRAAFAITMLLVGTLVRPEQVRAFGAAPARPLVGLLVQYTVMPFGAFLVSRCFADPVVRTGVILVGCMPGAMASNVMTVLLRGDLVLSVAMTTLATLATPLILLFWLPLLADATMAVSTIDLAVSAAWMVLAPVSVGLTLRRLLPRVPAWWERAASGVASASILLIVLVVVASSRGELRALGPALALGMLALNLGGYLVADRVGRWLRWPGPSRRALVVEVGMQNAGLGSVLALKHLGEAGAVPSAFYTVLCVLTAAAAVAVQGRRRG